MVDKDEIKDGNYDGIQEYDNDLPRWWIHLFWITILWGIGYAIWFHLPSTPTPHQRLAKQMADIRVLHDKQAAAVSAIDPAQQEERLLALTKNADALKQGSAVFATKCLPCHGPAGQGLVGPNLTDDFWIHGGKITEIKQVILEGVLEKGMLAWKAMLSSEEIDAVTAFIWSIHGTNPAGAKSPEGSRYERPQQQ